MERFVRDWKEPFVDEMGLIVALSGQERFAKLAEFKRKAATLSEHDQRLLKECLRQRFTPTNGNDGCASATDAVRQVT